ncbi:MAG: arsenate reductase (glutaredoxin) [Sulfurimonas sp.]|nr:arsenate reductase (glutaredoxin) [Sulfurimonas sp.]
MNKVTIWHNPSCSKSREAMNVLENNNSQIEIVKYLESTPSVSQIKKTLKMLNISPRELMRIKEDIYKELNLKDEIDDNILIQAMAKNPKLIERPVIIKGDRAIIGRPTDKIASFLNS